ncbi:MAG: hypothetical protein O3A01_07350 [bacterium]|nr:hypothetical protein [bacterium]
MKHFIFLFMAVLVLGLSGCGSSGGGGSSLVDTGDGAEGSEESLSPVHPVVPDVPAVISLQEVAVVGDVQLSDGFALATDQARLVVMRGAVLVFDGAVSLLAGAFDSVGVFDVPGSYSIAMSITQKQGTSTNIFYWTTQNMIVDIDNDVQLGQTQFKWASNLLAITTFPDIDTYSYEVELVGLGSAATHVVTYLQVQPDNSNMLYAIPLMPEGVYESVTFRYTQHSNGRVFEYVLENQNVARSEDPVRTIDFR